jgi:hypothetical protein
MFKQWFHGAAIAASLFSGMPYWRDENPRATARKAPTKSHH